MKKYFYFFSDLQQKMAMSVLTEGRTIYFTASFEKTDYDKIKQFPSKVTGYKVRSVTYSELLEVSESDMMRSSVPVRDKTMSEVIEKMCKKVKDLYLLEQKRTLAR